MPPWAYHGMHILPTLYITFVYNLCILILPSLALTSLPIYRGRWCECWHPCHVMVPGMSTVKLCNCAM